MMSIAQTIRGRRSIRSFNKESVSRELVMSLLNDAVWAPNHGLREPWRFIYVESAEGKAHLADLALDAARRMKRVRLLPTKLKEVMKRRLVDIPAHLVVVMKAQKNEHKQEEDFAAVCCLMQNLQLLGWEQKLGMFWSTYEFIHFPEFKEGLGIREDERIVGMLHMGYFNRVPSPKPRTPVEQKLTVW